MTPEVSEQSSTVVIKTKRRNDSRGAARVSLTSIIQDANGREIARQTEKEIGPPGSNAEVSQTLRVSAPMPWSDGRPYLYKVVSQLQQGRRILDRYETTLGIRTFRFDADKGFFLNGKPVKIRGGCSHHDLGSLGAAVNTRAMERQFEVLKALGVNGMRTSHDAPAPQ